MEKDGNSNFLFLSYRPYHMKSLRGRGDGADHQRQLLFIILHQIKESNETE